MAELQSTLMPDLWASSGSAAVVAPDATKIQSGWGLETVPLQWLNWFFKRTDNNLAYLLQKGIPEWTVGREYIKDKSYVQYLDVNGEYNVYRCKNTHTAVAGDVPSIGGVNWGLAFSKATPTTQAVVEANATILAGANGVSWLFGATKDSSGTIVSTPQELSDVWKTALATSNRSTIASVLGVQSWNAGLAGISSTVGAGTDTTNKIIYYTGATNGNGGRTTALATLTPFMRGLLSSADLTALRAAMSLGSLATQNSNSVDITGGSITGITDLAIADGGTGSSTVQGARNNLGIKASANYDVTSNPLDSISAFSPDYSDRSKRKVLLQGDGGILADVGVAPMVGGVYKDPTALTNGVRVAYTGTNEEFLNVHGIDLPNNGAPDTQKAFLVERFGTFDLSYIRATEVYGELQQNQTPRMFYKLYNGVTDTWSSWQSVFTTATTLDIGNTPTSARTALGLANSATIPASAANVPDTLVQRTIDNKISADVMGSLTGVASSATLLTDSRTINGTLFNNSANIVTSLWGASRTFTFTGDATGTLATNGGSNLSIPLTLANSGVVAGVYGGAAGTSPSITVDAKGRIISATTNDITLPVTQITGVLPVANGGSGTNTATGSGNNVLAVNPQVVAPRGTVGTVTSGIININSGTLFNLNVTAATTLIFSTTPPVGTFLSLVLHIVNGGSQLITWPSDLNWASGTPPLLTAGGKDAIGLYFDGTEWFGYLISKNTK